MVSARMTFTPPHADSTVLAPRMGCCCSRGSEACSVGTLYEEVDEGGGSAASEDSGSSGSAPPTPLPMPILWIQMARERAGLPLLRAWSPPPAATSEEPTVGASEESGYLDEVNCFDCGLCLSHWKAGDNPLKEHLKFSHMCTHANNIRSQIQEGCEPHPLIPTAVSTTGGEEPSIYEGRCSTQSVATRSQIQEIVCQSLPAFDCTECHQECADTLSLPCGHIDLCQKCVAIRRKTAVVAMGTAEHWESGNSAQLDECSLCGCGIRNFLSLDIIIMTR